MRSATQPLTGASRAPKMAETKRTTPTDPASRSGEPSTEWMTSGRYGSAICRPRKTAPETANNQRTVRSEKTPRTAPKASRTVLPVGTTSGRTSADPSASMRATAIERPADTVNTAALEKCHQLIMTAPIAGPSPNPSGLLEAKMPIANPSLGRGVTSRIAAIMTPELPSWKPTSTMLTASCHGAPLAATARNTTASTSALRITTALRLYLSAHTPHSGIKGNPARKNSEKSKPRT